MEGGGGGQVQGIGMRVQRVLGAWCHGTPYQGVGRGGRGGNGEGAWQCSEAWPAEGREGMRRRVGE